LLIDTRIIIRTSSFRSIPEVGARAFKNKGIPTAKNIGTNGQNPFVKRTVDIACSGRILEERRQGNISANNLTVVNMNKNSSINPSVKFLN